MKRRQERKLAVTTPRDFKSATRRVMAAATARAPKKSGVAKIGGEKVGREKAMGGPKTREGLERDLAAAEAKIKDMEKRLALVTDRIAWVADRLHSILDDNK